MLAYPSQRQFMDLAGSSSPHPQLEVISDSYYTEYRYYSNKTPRAPTNRQYASLEGIPFISHLVWLDAVVIALISYSWYESQDNRWCLLAVLGVFLLYVFWRCSGIIYESIIVIPPHGVQLETHIGPFKPLFVSRRFIPAVYIQDIIINEALRRWNVRYYLAIIVALPGENRELAVAFENTLPHFPVLLEVYHGVIQSLYNEKAFQ